MAMNNKNTPSGKSLKMSADDLKEMVKAAVAECLGEEKEDLSLIHISEPTRPY